MGQKILVGLVLLVMPASSRAAVVYVDSGAVSSGENGSSWADAYTDLQDALAHPSLGSGDDIWVAAGTYRPTNTSDRTVSFELVAGVALYGGFAGGESARGDRDWTTNETILSGDISGDAQDSHHVVVGATGAVLDGFTVTGGRADKGAFDRDDRGGGMYNENVSPTIRNCTFSANNANYEGGAVYNYGGSPAIEDCTFTTNSAPTRGGAVFSHDCSTAISGCRFLSNTVGGGDGGAVYNWNCAAPITNCLFYGNSAGSGGAIKNYYLSSPTVTNCTFTLNSASGQGGAFLNANDSHPELVNCILWGDLGDYPEIRNDGASSCTAKYSDIGQVGSFVDSGGVINADPLWMDVATADFRLNAGSPCIDSGWGDGYATVPAADLGGDPRHDDTGIADTGAGTPTFIDMGAYEFQGTTPPEWIVVGNPGTGDVFDATAGVGITWATSPSMANVRIELSRDAGAGWAYIDGGGALANSGSFTWSSSGPASSSCIVRVSNAGGGSSAESGVFVVREQMIVALSQVLAMEGAGTLSIGTVSIPTARSSPLDVSLSSNDTTEATVPPTVTIQAGSTSAPFDVTVEEDTEADGMQTVEISASADAYMPGSDDLVVQDYAARLGIGGGASCGPEHKGTAGGLIVPLGLLMLSLLVRRRRRDTAFGAAPGTIAQVLVAVSVLSLSLPASASAAEKAEEGSPIPVAGEETVAEKSATPSAEEDTASVSSESVARSPLVAPAGSTCQAGIRIGVFAPVGGDGIAYDAGPEIGLYWQRDLMYGRCALELGGGLARLVAEDHSSTDDVLSGTAIFLWRLGEESPVRGYAIVGGGMLLGSARNATRTDTSTMGEVEFGAGVQLRGRTDLRATASFLLNGENATGILRLSLGVPF
jgi:uncharacterized protein (TIGR03382 family)